MAAVRQVGTRIVWWPTRKQRQAELDEAVALRERAERGLTRTTAVTDDIQQLVGRNHIGEAVAGTLGVTPAEYQRFTTTRRRRT